MKVSLNLRWKIIAIYAVVMIAGVAIAANVIQQRYQTTFIEQQLFDLEKQQTQIIADLPLYIAQRQFQPLNRVETLIIDQQKNILSQSGFPEQRLQNELLQIAQSQQQAKLQYHYEIGEELMNVQITKLSEPTVTIISYVLTGVPSFLSNVLLQEVVTLFSLLFFCGSGIFLLWSLYLAKDLKKINHFAQQLGVRNWQAQLEVKRHDEIGEMAKKLQAVQQQLALAEAQQNRFFHHTSHDLKTPIAVIQGYAEAIADGIYPQGDLDASIAIIQNEAQVLNHKVEQLLRFAKMQQVQPNSQSGKTELSEVITALIHKIEPLSPQLQITLDVKATSQWSGSVWEWEQVISNLLENATRYAKTVIVVTLTDTSLSVYNDGPSFTPTEQQQIFEPFVSGRGGNYGLGLAICAQFATQYKLQLRAENHPNGGVCFWLTKQTAYKHEREN